MAAVSPPRRLALSVLSAVLAIVASVSVATAVDDTTAPTGTLTVGPGTGFVSSVNVPLHVPATDDVGVATVRVFLNGQQVMDVPYAETITMPVPYPERQYQVYVQWWDAAGNGQGSEEVVFYVDTTAPLVDAVSFADDPDPSDAVLPVSIRWNDESGVDQVRFRTGTGAWGAPIPADRGENPAVVEWPFLDPSAGGSAIAGPRSVSIQVRNAAGLWSAVLKRTIFAGFGDSRLTVSGDVRTGHDVTFTPEVPAGVTYPSGTVCWWELFWGDDQSLYEGDRDSTFGSITISGPPSKGYCDPWTVTLPWVPVRQFLVSFRADLDGEPIVDVSLGSSPTSGDHVRPGVDSTSRHIKRSSLPLVYVLPEDYILVVGEPTTYRGYAVGGETMKSTDIWTVAYIDTPERHRGGTSLTFTPRRTGHITVCWGSDEHRKYQIAACFDPPAKRRDRTKPTVTVPVAGFGNGTGGALLPIEVSWTGKDVGWGVKSYKLQRSIDGGAWKTVALPKAKSTSIVQQVANGTQIRYRVRATDKAGNVGAWKTTRTIRPVRYEDSRTIPDLVYSADWAARDDATANGGTVHEASIAGRSVTFTFKGRSIAWLAQRGPGFGQAKVYVDGKLSRTIDLAATVDMPQRIVYRKRWSTPGTHKVRIVVVGTPTRPVVDLDAFAVLR